MCAFFTAPILRKIYFVFLSRQGLYSVLFIKLASNYIWLSCTYWKKLQCYICLFKWLWNQKIRFGVMETENPPFTETKLLRMEYRIFWPTLIDLTLFCCFLPFISHFGKILLVHSWHTFTFHLNCVFYFPFIVHTCTATMHTDFPTWSGQFDWVSWLIQSKPLHEVCRHQQTLPSLYLIQQ